MRSALVAAAAVGALGFVAVEACITEHVRPVVEAGPLPVNIVPCDGGGPGNTPDPTCEPSDNSCPTGPDSGCPSCGACPIDAAVCGSPTTCMPLADNSKKTTYDFRLRRLYITAPAPLTTSIIEGTTGVVTMGIDLAAPQCGDTTGTGAFNWLVHVDPANQQVLTGGAPPSSDPFQTGYCFYRHLLGPLDVEPSTVPATFDGGTFTTGTIPLLNVPIFLKADGGAADPNNVIILPLRSVTLRQAALSDSNNCIGSFNPLALDGMCSVHDPSSCTKWRTAGALGAYMTLEDADQVPLSILPRTLCVLLTSSSGVVNDAGITTCERDAMGHIVAQGDYCSQTNMPGGCADSYWLSATFAASAVTINDGSSEPTCQGPTDASAE